MVEYAVESIKKGKKRGTTRYFKTKADAVKYASKQYGEGKGVVVDRLTQTGQRAVIQKGLSRTGFGESHKEFAKDFGSLPKYKKRKINPFGF